MWVTCVVVGVVHMWCVCGAIVPRVCVCSPAGWASLPGSAGAGRVPVASVRVPVPRVSQAVQGMVSLSCVRSLAVGCRLSWADCGAP